MEREGEGRKRDEDAWGERVLTSDKTNSPASYLFMRLSVPCDRKRSSNPAGGC